MLKNFFPRNAISLIRKTFVNNISTSTKILPTANPVFKYTYVNRQFFKKDKEHKEEKDHKDKEEKDHKEEEPVNSEKEQKEEKKHEKTEEHHHKEHKHHEEGHKYKELKQSHHELENKYEALKKKFEEIRRAYLDNQDETKHIITRYDKQITDAKVYAISKFAKDILDVHDNFARAMSSIEPAEFKNLSEEEKVSSFNTFLEGIQMTQDGLTKILKRHGVTEYNPLKEEFNPHNHEAVFDYADDDPEAIPVGQVMQSGFKIGDRILRPAKVGVIKKK
jgi:molecular chaperone GrpE